MLYFGHKLSNLYHISQQSLFLIQSHILLKPVLSFLYKFTEQKQVWSGSTRFHKFEQHSKQSKLF